MSRYPSVILLLSCLLGTTWSFVPIFGGRPTTSRLLLSPSSDDRRHSVEFTNLEPLPETDRRRERIERDLENRAQFVDFGDELWALRSKMDQLSARLLDAITHGSPDTEEITRAKLRRAEQKDPELVYMLELADYQDAVGEGRATAAEEHLERAMAARSCLPQFNLDGLWVGKYGSHGYELINVTYVGDTLIGSKVTGDRNVPRGEITFQVDLNPLQRMSSSSSSASTSSSPQSTRQSIDPGNNGSTLQPIQLTDQAAQKWGTSQLPRYAGLGQVAEEGFRNNQWMDGQLIIIGQDYFSFAWLPIEQQIFFGRPSPELALKMLRESGQMTVASTFATPPSLTDDVQVQRDFVTRCLEMTHEFVDEVTGGFEDDQVGCIWHDSEDECYFE